MAISNMNTVLLALSILFVLVNCKVLPEVNTVKAVFPPAHLYGDTSNSTVSFSEKIVNFTENGLEKLKSGVTSLINNVSNVFNNSQDAGNIILGAACSENANCSGVTDATCDKGMCNCGPNFTVAFSMPDRCLRVVKLNESCQEDVQCSKQTVGAICSGSHCICSDLYTEEEGRCVSKKKLGSTCNVKEDCVHIPFAECIAGICACPKPLISSVYNNACLILASPAGEPPCQEDLQCTATYGNRTRCLNGICSCDKDYHSYNGKCIPDLKLGDQCSMMNDCIVSKFTEEPFQRECFNHTCSCKPGYSAVSENQCLKGYGYQLQASLAWLLCIFLLPYLF